MNNFAFCCIFSESLLKIKEVNFEKAGARKKTLPNKLRNAHTQLYRQLAKQLSCDILHNDTANDLITNITPTH